MHSSITRWVVGLSAMVCFAPLSRAESLSLRDYRHVTFDKIPVTKYQEEAGGLKAEVSGSSSFLLKAFPSVRVIKGLKWKWKQTGDFRVTTEELLKSKKGDDTILRVGLIKAGDAPSVPFFAPAWIKAIRDHMKLPGDEMVYFVSGGPAKAGTKWESPYSDSMSLIQVESTALADGWFEAKQAINPPLKAVGLWIMADGDNTESKFTTWMKDLELLE